MSGYICLALILVAGLALIGYRARAISKAVEERTSGNGTEE